MIVSLHVATGAAGGALVRSRPAAVALGLALHLAGDLVPHQDIDSRRFEISSGVAGMLLLIARRGAFDPATIGALAASSPDIEHVIPLPRPGGRKLFPTHRIRGWHRAGGLPTWLQLVAAGVLLGVVVSR
ncbi:MAG TPA: hypothetical protein VF895_10315 [Gaiellaceae bacterium]